MSIVTNNNYKPIPFIVVERKFRLGKNAGKVLKVAHPTRRKRVSFSALAEETAQNITLSSNELQAALNELAITAKRHLSNGDSVELGIFGTLILHSEVRQSLRIQSSTLRLISMLLASSLEETVCI